jgi:NTE family protein
MLFAKKNTVALSLGGGGARGYAHIGVLKELEKRNLEVVALAGTSMGAVIGALYAAGKLAEFEKWARKLTKLDVVGLMDFSIGKAGAIRAERIMNVVDEMLEGINIEDLPIPFTAVATDLLENKEVHFTSGPATLALRASVAIPGMITPVVIDKKLLADGGMVNPVPLAPLKNARARHVIAVDLAQGRKANPFEKELSEHFLKRAVTVTIESSKTKVVQIAKSDKARKLAKQLGVDTRIQEIVKPVEETPLQRIINDVPKVIKSADVLSLSVQTMQQQLTQVEFKNFRPDVVIGIPMDACGTLEFYMANQMIELGELMAAKELNLRGL